VPEIKKNDQNVKLVKQDENVKLLGEFKIKQVESEMAYDESKNQGPDGLRQAIDMAVRLKKTPVEKSNYLPLIVQKHKGA
jgi:hypothetical protein